MRGDAEETTLTDIHESLLREPRNDCIVVIYHADAAELGRRVNLSGGLVRIGRKSDNDIVLDEDAVSRRHARLERRDDSWILMDVGSRNGTRLNESRMSGFRVLRNGDRIKIGSVILKYLTGEDIENQFFKEIFQLTITDNLTRLANKRAFDDELGREFFRALRHERPLSVLMLDIDFFKDVNDTHGHQAGDAVLQALGELLQSRVRVHDLAARVGGEEFAVLLPETSLLDASAVAEALRLAVAELDVEFNGVAIKVTASIGGAESQATDEGVFDLMSRCDKQLYAAKRSGRNRVAS